MGYLVKGWYYQVDTVLLAQGESMKATQLVWMLYIPTLVSGSPFVNNPRKVAEEQAIRAFKTAGVHVRGIVGNVNEVQDAVGRIKKETDEVQRAIYAPYSPFSRLKRIAHTLEQFQKNVPDVEKIMSVTDVQRLLRSADLNEELLQRAADAPQKSVLLQFSSSYNALIAEMDTVVIHAILHHNRQLLYDVAGMIDSVAHIRDYAGDYADNLLDLALAEGMQAVSGSVREVARKLDEIMRGGSVSMRAERGTFAEAVLKNKEKIPVMIDTMQESSSAFTAAVQQVQADLMKMGKEKNGLIRAATLMQKRLTQVLLKAHKGDDGQNLAMLADRQLQTMMEGLRIPIISLLRITVDTLGRMMQGTKEGLSGIDAFKKNIDFDVVNPVVRLDLDALPNLLRDLSRTIVQLREKLV
jgi:hypothetical protein